MTADSADRPTALVDGSVALPALSEQHEFHDVAFAAVSEHRVGIAAHALFETYAVLTRHPSLRVTPAQALALLDGTFKHRAALSSAATDRALKALAAGAISGGSTYDGVVAATRGGERGRERRAQLCDTHHRDGRARRARAGLPLLTVT